VQSVYFIFGGAGQLAWTPSVDVVIDVVGVNGSGTASDFAVSTDPTFDVAADVQNGTVMTQLIAYIIGANSAETRTLGYPVRAGESVFVSCDTGGSLYLTYSPAGIDHVV